MIGRYDQAKERQAYITDQLTNNKQQQYRNAKACHSEKKDERKKNAKCKLIFRDLRAGEFIFVGFFFHENKKSLLLHITYAN